MELTFFVEKHYDDASYRTNWKSTLTKLHSQLKLPVTLLRVVFTGEKAVEIRPKIGTEFPLSDVFSHLDLID